jgi:hypothetical protein
MRRSARSWVRHTASAPNPPWRWPDSGPWRCDQPSRQRSPWPGRAFFLETSFVAQNLIGVIQPDVLVGHAALEESVSRSPGLLTVLEQQPQEALGREEPGAQATLADLSIGQSWDSATRHHPDWRGDGSLRDCDALEPAPHYAAVSSREQVRAQRLTPRGRGDKARTPGTGSAGIGSRWPRRRPLVRRRHSTPPRRRTVCRWEAAGPPQWVSCAAS